jgi:ATP-dependent Clp endopeptidase proteolytic subunit ClpP
MNPFNITDARLEFTNIDNFIDGDELQHGIVFLNDEIDTCAVSKGVSQLDFVKRIGVKSVTLRINSPGGGVCNAFALYDKIKELENAGIPTTGVVIGSAASAASMIVLQACRYRTATPSSRLHLHEVSQWSFMEDMKTSKMEEDLAELNKLTDMVLTVLEKRTGHSKAEIKEFIYRKEKWLSAQEALDWKLIDSIV